MSPPAENKLDGHYEEETSFNIPVVAHLCTSGESIWENSNKPKILLEKRESIQSEKQISVDPISLRSVEIIMSVPQHNTTNYLQSRPAAKSSKFLSCSLPNSASSSPLTTILKQQKKKRKDDRFQLAGPLVRQHSVALSNLERLRESHLRRSKSCGEGRACQPSVDFDLLSGTTKINIQETENMVEGTDHKQHCEAKSESCEDKFKCGALCLFLPGFGKAAKPVRSRKDPVQMGMEGHIVSQRVSLEKFECGSWRSSAIIMNTEDDGDTTSNLFFDLPMELIGCSTVNDTEFPVTTAFVFDNNTHDSSNNKDHYRKGALKSGATSVTANPCPSSSSKLVQGSESSSNSLRHVRFSISSPRLYPVSPTSCITPRLRKARDDFNAFLEAQNA